MDERFATLAAAAANRHGAFTTTMAHEAGISDRLRLDWLADGRIHRLGPHTFAFAGTPITWRMRLAAALGDLGPAAAVAGRSTATLQHLDGFHQGPVEVWVPKSYRNRARTPTTRMSSRPLLTGDVVTIDGLRCVSAERLILDSLLFRFNSAEIHNAIDSAIRMRLVNEKRVRERVIRDLATNAPHRRRLLDALIDSGGESALERHFLALLRQAGLPRPQLQRTYRAGTRTLARVDAEFANGLVVELAGHGTHASRTQRQRDAQRHTELTLRNKTSDHVHLRRRVRPTSLDARHVARCRSGNRRLTGHESSARSGESVTCLPRGWSRGHAVRCGSLRRCRGRGSRHPWC